MQALLGSGRKLSRALVGRCFSSRQSAAGAVEPARGTGRVHAVAPARRHRAEAAAETGRLRATSRRPPKRVTADEATAAKTRMVGQAAIVGTAPVEEAAGRGRGQQRHSHECAFMRYSCFRQSRAVTSYEIR
jgi:hypothetical protein